jgi:hypothetical protein
MRYARVASRITYDEGKTLARLVAMLKECPVKLHHKHFWGLLVVCFLWLAGCGSSGVAVQSNQFVAPNLTPTVKPPISLQVHDAQSVPLTPMINTSTSTVGVKKYLLTKGIDGNWGTYTFTATSTSAGGMKDITIQFSGFFKGCDDNPPATSITQGKDANGNVSTLLSTTFVASLNQSDLPVTCTNNLTTGYATVVATAHDWAGDTNTAEADLCLDATCK